MTYTRAIATDKVSGRICPTVDGWRKSMNGYNPDRWPQKKWELFLSRSHAKRKNELGFDPLDPPGGIEFRVTIEPEDYPDLSYLGEFTNKWEPGAISHLRRHGTRREYEWFIPEADTDDIAGYMNTHGYSKGVAAYHAQIAPFRDYYRMADYGNGWSMVIVIVTMLVDNQPINSLSIGGVESDSDQSYFDELSTDLKFELAQQLPNWKFILKERANRINSILDLVHN